LKGRSERFAAQRALSLKTVNHVNNQTDETNSTNKGVHPIDLRPRAGSSINGKMPKGVIYHGREALRRLERDGFIRAAAVAAFSSLLFCGCQSRRPPAPPDAAPVIEDYHGIQISDPYRHLENLKDPAVDSWYRAQGEFARETLDGIPGRSKVLAQLRDFDSRKSDTVTHLIVTESDHHFYLKRTPEEDVAKLYCREGFDGREQLLFDPDAFEPGTKPVIAGLSAPVSGGLRNGPRTGGYTDQGTGQFHRHHRLRLVAGRTSRVSAPSTALAGLGLFASVKPGFSPARLFAV
jgi:hypothetical protein